MIGSGKSSLIDMVTDEPLNIDVTGNLGTIKVLVLLTELVKIPSVRKQVVELLHLQEGTADKQSRINQTEESEDAPIILSNMMPTENNNPTHKPFFISLCIGDLVLHNYMFDSVASTNVMPLAVMKRLGLQLWTIER